jgi:hypothetical protein
MQPKSGAKCRDESTEVSALRELGQELRADGAVVAPSGSVLGSEASENPAPDIHQQGTGLLTLPTRRHRRR